MQEEILVNFAPSEVRVAVVESGVLQEIHIERSHRRGCVGNIYNGKVVRVLPGMQAAFVDIGLEKAAFLYVADVIPQKNAQIQEKAASKEETEDGIGDIPQAAPVDSSSSLPPISSLLREGQSLVVQVTKDPIGSKGARLTTHLSIPSRYLVFIPGSAHIGVSQRIEDTKERERLRTLVRTLAEREGISEENGFIVRTVAESVSEEDILSDLRYLVRLWNKLSTRIKITKPGKILYEDCVLPERVVRDLARVHVDRIRIDHDQELNRLQEFAKELVPEVFELLESYQGARPLFELYGIEDEVNRALERKVPLKSGGYLVIDHTEAMTTIDVNTGAFVGRRNLAETIFRTNLEAAASIARQLRLRNIGGIIIIDFIDMEVADHQRQVLRVLEKQLEKDHSKSKITTITPLGLVEMTRKRTRESLLQMLSEPCTVCHGKGSIKTPETVCYEVYRELYRMASEFSTASFRVVASQNVVDLFLDEFAQVVADLEQQLDKTINFQVESMYTPEQFDIVPIS